MNPRHRAFVEQYLVDLNATRAAVRAGYAVSNAKYTARDLMGRPDIQAAITEAQAARAERVEDTQDAVLREIIATGRAAFAAKKFDAAIRALELRGRHQGMFKDKVELSGKVDGAVHYVANMPKRTP